MRWLARLRRTSVHEWRLMGEALLLVLRIRVSLWIHPFKRVQATYVARDERSVGNGDGYLDVATAKAVGVAVRRSSRLVPGATCLPQALATRVMLGRRGVPNALLFGVARAENGALQAHAWIEVGEVVVAGDLPDLARYQRMPDLPEPGR